MNGVRRAVRKRMAGVRIRVRSLTAPWRMLPNVLIIGAQRCGTTFLFRYLTAHPEVTGSCQKEVGFFTLHFDKGLAWYRAHFPYETQAQRAAGSPVCIEATPEYLLDPRAPKRAATILPGVRIIVLVRNPVDRAVSHYLLMRRLGFEQLSFEDAIDQEAARLEIGYRELERSPHDPLPCHLRHHSYVARGRYAEQLERWYAACPAERILVVRSEELFTRPAATLSVVTSFLGLPPLAHNWFTKSRNGQDGQRAPFPLAAATAERLQTWFRPWNQRLEAMLGRRMDW